MVARSDAPTSEAVSRRPTTGQPVVSGVRLFGQKLPDTNELVIPLDAKPEMPTVVVLGWKKPDAPTKPKK
jgi:hypothetical protein